jgi:hypothetical protein
MEVKPFFFLLTKRFHESILYGIGFASIKVKVGNELLKAI